MKFPVQLEEQDIYLLLIFIFILWFVQLWGKSKHTIVTPKHIHWLDQLLLPND